MYKHINIKKITKKDLFMIQILFILLALTIGQSSYAEQNSKETEKKLILYVVDDCGYCSNHDYQVKLCTINEDSKVEIVDHIIGKKEITENKIISYKKLDELKILILLTKNGKLSGKIETGSGEPSFF